MAALGNLIWFVLVGANMGIAWWLSGLIVSLTVIGIPFGKACFRISWFAWVPFGKELVDRPHKGVATQTAGILWLVLFGWWIALGHLISAALLAASCLLILPILVGAPVMAVGHLRLAQAAIQPLGKEIMDREIAKTVRTSAAERSRGFEAETSSGSSGSSSNPFEFN